MLYNYSSILSSENVRPITSEETGNPLDRNSPPAIRRLGWGLLVGAIVVSLPWLASKVDNGVLLLVGEILGWPGAILRVGPRRVECSSVYANCVLFNEPSPLYRFDLLPAGPT